MPRERNELAKKANRQNPYIYILYLLLIALIIAYVETSMAFIGLAALVVMIITIAVEFRTGIKEVGLKKTAAETAIAVVVIIIVLWFLPSVLLGTSSPIDVVVSCSMVPTLHRGDIVLLHGINNMSKFLSSRNIPVVNASAAEYSAMIANISSEELYPYAYNQSSLAGIVPSRTGYGIALFNLACILRGEPLPRCYANASYQSKNLISYTASFRNATEGGRNVSIAAVSSISINGISVTENYSNPIIVYKARSATGLNEDIIHRLYAAVRVGSEYYLLTKGDNNAVLDLEGGIYPPNQSEVVGYVIVSIPLLGYPSLIIRGQISQSLTEGCNQTIFR